MTSPTTLPPGHEIISPDIANQMPDKMKVWSKGDPKWTTFYKPTHLAKILGAGLDHENCIFSAPIGTLAALSTPLPEVRCECGFDEEWSDDPNPRTECDLDCPTHPRNLLVRVLPGQLAGLKVKPEGLKLAHPKRVNWENYSLDWPFEYTDGYAYALPQWSYDAAMWRGEKDLTKKEVKTCAPPNSTNPDASAKPASLAETSVKMGASNAAPETSEPFRAAATAPDLSTLIGTGQPQDLKVRVTPPAPSDTPKAQIKRNMPEIYYLPQGFGTGRTERKSAFDCEMVSADSYRTLETELSTVLARAEQAEREVKRLTDKCIDMFRLVQERFHECGRFRDPNFQPGGE